MGETSDWDALFTTIARPTGVVEEDAAARTTKTLTSTDDDLRSDARWRKSSSGPGGATCGQEQDDHPGQPLRPAASWVLDAISNNAGASPDAAAPAPPTLPDEAPAAASALPELAAMERQRK